MKKYFLLFFSFSLVFLLASCSGEDTPTDEALSQAFEEVSEDIELLAAPEDPVWDTSLVDDEALNDAIAYIEDITWDVLKIGKSGKKSLKEWDLLLEGERVITLKQSKATIVFEDDSLVRLDENTTFSVDAYSLEEISTTLNKWSIWGRILRPVWSETDFTVATDDVSATVRGTSLFMSSSEVWKLTALQVIDSYAEDSVRVKKQQEEITLNPEEEIIIQQGEKLQKQKIELTQVLEEKEFVRDNTKQDIVYMKKLLEKEKIQGEKTPETIEKIEIEIKNTIPKQEEIESFLESEELKKQVIVRATTQEQIEQDIIELIVKDEIIKEVKNKENKISSPEVDSLIEEIIREDFKAESTQETLKKAQDKANEVKLENVPKLLRDREEVFVQEVTQKESIQEENTQKENAQEEIEEESQQDISEKVAIKEEILKRAEQRELQEELEREKQIEASELQKEEETQEQVEEKAPENTQISLPEEVIEDIVIETPKEEEINQDETKQEEIRQEEQETQTIVYEPTPEELQKKKFDAYKYELALESKLAALIEEKADALQKAKDTKIMLDFSTLDGVTQEDKDFSRELSAFVDTESQKVEDIAPEKISQNIEYAQIVQDLDILDARIKEHRNFIEKFTSNLDEIQDKTEKRRRDIIAREQDIILEDELLDIIEIWEEETEINTQEEEKVTETLMIETQEILEDAVDEVINIKEETIEIVENVVEEKEYLLYPKEFVLKAELIVQDGFVKLEWKWFSQENFLYYNLVHSQDVTHPVYPDDTTIAVLNDMYTLAFKDYNSFPGVNHYTVCGVFLDDDREEIRHCSNSVSVINDIQKQIDEKKQNLKRDIDGYIQKRYELFAQTQEINVLLDFSSLENKNEEDKDFAQQKHEELDRYRRELESYDFESIWEKISRVEKLWEFEAYEKELDTMQNAMLITGENIYALQKSVEEKRLEISLRKPVEGILDMWKEIIEGTTESLQMESMK